MIEEFGTKTQSGDPDPDLYLCSHNPNPPELLNKKRDRVFKTPTLEQWAYNSSNSFTAIGKTEKSLPPGLYTAESHDGHIFFVERDINVDELFRFPDSVADKVLNEVSKFWSKSKIFRKYGFLHRRGYLLYGDQGGGKTCIVQLITADIIRRGGLVLSADTNPEFFDSVLQVFRAVEPRRPLVCLYEDIDAIIRQWGEAGLLSILDGESQINTVINLATTNFPELLPKRLVSRPRRFDRVLKIGFPNDSIRRIYFEKKLHISPEKVEKYVKASEGMSFASCAELVISVECLENTFEETVEKLNEVGRGKYSSEDFKERVGFQK